MGVGGDTPALDVVGDLDAAARFQFGAGGEVVGLGQYEPEAGVAVDGGGDALQLSPACTV